MFFRYWCLIGICFQLITSGVLETDDCVPFSNDDDAVGICVNVLRKPTTCSCFMNCSTDGLYCTPLTIKAMQGISSCPCALPTYVGYPCGAVAYVYCECCSFCGRGQFLNVTISVDKNGYVTNTGVACIETSNLQSSTIAQTSSTSSSTSRTTSSSTSISTSATRAGGNVPAIVGGVVGVVGGLILIAVIVLIAIVLYRRRRKSPSNSNRTFDSTTSAADRKFNDYEIPNRVVSVPPAPYTQLRISPSERETSQNELGNENGYYANEQIANPPSFNPNAEPDPYNNYPIVSPGMSHGDTNEITVVDNQLYAGNAPSETVTMTTEPDEDDTTLVDNQFYAGSPR